MPQWCVSPTIGIDGCRVGWVYAVADDGLSVWIIVDFDAVWDPTRERDARWVFVDIPIRLPESDRRTRNRAAREWLGSRAATVFFAPVRSVLNTDSHEAASAANRERTGAGFSIQTWHLVPKIREADAILREASHARSRVFESHSELAFAAFAGDSLPELKSTPERRIRRLDVLGTALGGYDGRNGDDDNGSDDGSETNATGDREFDTERAYREMLDRTLRRGVARDNVLDALVLTAAARRPLVTLPSDPPVDTVELEMTIRVPTDGPPPRTEFDNHARLFTIVGSTLVYNQQ